PLTLSLHDALPILRPRASRAAVAGTGVGRRCACRAEPRLSPLLPRPIPPRTSDACSEWSLALVRRAAAHGADDAVPHGHALSRWICSRLRRLRRRTRHLVSQRLSARVSLSTGAWRPA